MQILKSSKVFVVYTIFELQVSQKRLEENKICSIWLNPM